MSDQKVRQAIECGLAPCGYLMAFSLLISFDCYFQGVVVLLVVVVFCVFFDFKFQKK